MLNTYNYNTITIQITIIFLKKPRQSQEEFMACVPESFDPNAVPLHKIILSLNIPFLRSIVESILQESYLTKDV